jgi:hypothetical protein
VSRGPLAIVASTGIAALLLVQALGATAAMLVDANDARGPLDVRRVNRVAQQRPIWKVGTYGRWRAPPLVDRGYVLVWLDTFGSPRFDYYILVRASRRGLGGSLVSDRRRPRRDRTVGPVGVWRRNLRSLSLQVALRRMIVGKGRDSYRWAVQTVVTGRKCRTVCFDRAPNRGTAEVPLSGPSPTPSPTD